MTVENGMDRALGRHPKMAGKAPDQEFADLACFKETMRLSICCGSWLA